MKETALERRHLLRSTTAWVAALAGLAAARPARALQVQSISPNSPLGLSYANHCGGLSDHDALVAQLKTVLAKNPGAKSLSTTCPICGCPVTVTL